MDALLESVLNFMKTLYYAENVVYPTSKELRLTAEKYGTRMVYGNYNFVSTVKNRSAWLTVNIGPKSTSMSTKPKAKRNS